MKGYGRVATVLMAVWFALVLSASALHLFKNAANRVGGAVGLAALAPIVIFFVWFAASDGFRRFALSLNPRTLTYLQSWRVIGLEFVILEAHGVLPAVFALPAGYGDFAIGATASLVAWRLANSKHRGSFILWQALGIADLVLAVSLGVTAPLLSPHSTPMVAMTVLPLNLIPTFLVPLFLIFHVISIAQARSWTNTSPGSGHTARSAEGLAAGDFQA
jgi:hypothetical protein